ncbi:MAG: chemotaxis protein CheA [Rhodocyclaceae bacterium]|nr:chemotaxis protein CheA [Rhodocyclaceae bacterium]
MNTDMARALDTFLEESRELLEQMEHILLAAESGCLVPDLHALFRCAHTIKGSAGLFGLEGVVRFTHGVESVLDRLRNGEIAFDPALSALLLECRDHIGALVRADCGGNAVPAAVGDGLTRRLQAWLSPAAPAAPLRPTAGEPVAASGGGLLGGADHWHLSLRFGLDVLRHGMDPLSFIHYLGQCGEIVHLETLHEGLPGWRDYDPESCYLGFEIDFKSEASKEEIEEIFDFVRGDATVRILPPHSRVVEAAVVDAALDKQKRGEERKALEARSLKVPSERLDQLIDRVGELVIAGAATQILAEASRQPALKESAANLLRLVEDIRDTTLKLRMVPIGEVFSRFPRVVRDVARELGKDIELKIGGADTELDKSMVEKIADPLTHMVRNAIDHGIEPEAVRLAAGKPGRGTLRLDAYHDSGGIVIEVADDGGGLDCGRILQKARERGLVGPDQHLSRPEIFRLILAPGFSTAERVTNLSGRGVGMDVVKSSVDALRGTLDIESEAGRGTVMRICLPLTLAIIDGFQVALGNNIYIVPLDMVVECIELPPDPGAEYLNLRDEILPLVRLRSLFEIEGPAPARQNVVVVRLGRRKAGLVVDRLLGEFQTVIKPLSKIFDRLQGVGGSTILGSGQVALIVDVPALLGLAARRAEAGEPAG